MSQPTTPINPQYLLNRERWRAYLAQSKRNPAIMLRAGFDYLADATDGKLDFVDVSNPITLAMEFGAQIGANNFNQFAQADKKHYPALSTQMEDLYHHMSDDLYAGRFASPSTGRFNLVFLKEEIINHAVETHIRGLHKLIIPRGTRITVDGIIYTVLTAIEIRVSAYDAIQVVYSNDYRDDYEYIESNILEYYFGRNQNNDECLYIEVPVMQVHLTRHTSELTHIGRIFNEVYSYPDQFIQVRAYLEDTSGQVKEIAVSHSDFIYDPSRITARVKVLSGNLIKVDIPILYYNIKLLETANVIVEIYSTKGQVNIPLSKLTTSEDVVVDMDFTNDEGITPEDTIYTAPLSELYAGVYSTQDSVGGSNGLSFEKIKYWVINGGREKETPITHANFRKKADMMGYSLITDVDNITNRIFQATRELEKPSGGEFNSGVGCSIEPVAINIAHLERHPHVSIHGDRATIKPSALFKTNNGQTTLLWDEDVPKIDINNVDGYINNINGLEYIYTPFYYCLDNTEKSFKVRAYHMDSPRYITQQFIDNNSTTELLVAVDKAEIIRSPNGYILRIISRSNEQYKALDHKDLFVQIGFTAYGQDELAYVNGRLVGFQGEDGHVWEFDIDTTFDFDTQGVILNNFKILSTEHRKLSCPLKPTFTVVFGVMDYQGNHDIAAPINKRAGQHILPLRREITVISENTVTVNLGHALKNLWVGVRTTESAAGYATYQENIPLRYTENVYKLGDDGLPKYTVGSEGEYEFEVIHRIGDIVTNEHGETIYKHRVGDVILDEQNRPVVVKPKSVQRIVDMFFIDGIYRFSTDKGDIQYINSIPETVINWLETDITQLQKGMLERTSLYFTPKRTMGYIGIIAENGIRKTIFNRLPFKVKLYLTDRAYQNYELRDALTKMVSRIINESLLDRTISKDVIENRLREAGGVDNILGVNVTDMGVGQDVNTFTVVKQGNQCSVRRKIHLLSDGTLKVREDIQVEFINHEKRSLDSRIVGEENQ